MFVHGMSSTGVHICLHIMVHVHVIYCALMYYKCVCVRSHASMCVCVYVCVCVCVCFVQLCEGLVSNLFLKRLSVLPVDGTFRRMKTESLKLLSGKIICTCQPQPLET